MLRNMLSYILRKIQASQLIGIFCYLEYEILGGFQICIGVLLKEVKKSAKCVIKKKKFPEVSFRAKLRPVNSFYKFLHIIIYWKKMDLFKGIEYVEIFE